MNIEVIRQAEKSILKLKGRFDFACHRDFRNAYTPLLEANEKQFDIDLSDVEYMDSAALGMLLLMQERAENGGASITLVGARGVVRDILDVAHFERFFTLAG